MVEEGVFGLKFDFITVGFRAVVDGFSGTH